MIKSSLYILLFVSSASLFAQGNKTQLEQERLELIRKIENSTNHLAEAKKNKSSLLSQINALEIQIDSREKLIANLEKETSIIESHLIETDEEMQIVSTQAQPLIDEYNELLRIRYRNKLLTKNYFSLWNSKKVSELITKWRIFKNFESTLIAKGERLKALDDQSQNLLSDKSEQENKKDYILEEEKRQLDSLVLKKKTLLNLAKNLTFKEREVLSLLSTQKSTREEYNRAIESTIRGAVQTNAKTTTQINVAYPDYSKTGIAAKQGFLPSPLANPSITKRYGPQDHPSASGIKITNHGIDLSSDDPTTRCIFDGTVISISKINNQGQTVIIQHDADYYSVYTNLQNVAIRNNETILQGQVIGTAKTNRDNKAALHFEFWKGKKNLNPKHWLKNN